MLRRPLVAVLVIEDDEYLGSTLAEALTLEGYRVHHVTTLGAALDYLRNVRPELILADATLPDAGPATVIPRLRAAAPGTPLAMLTGRRTLPAHLLATADEVLLKPFGIDSLYGVVQRLIGSPVAEAAATH